MITIKIDTMEAERKLARIGRALNKRGLLKAIGLRQLRWIDDNFKSDGKLAGGWKPLSENTVAGRRGGSGRILQDTGKLRMSFTSKMESEDTLWVGSQLDVAEWHHFGTRPYDIRPVRAQVLSFITVGGRVFARYVHHPGLPARRMLPTQDEAKDMGVRLLEAHVKRLDEGMEPHG
jgi:phage gpG-like protein